MVDSQSTRENCGEHRMVQGTVQSDHFSAVNSSTNTVLVGAALGAAAAVTLLGALNLSAHQVKVRERERERVVCCVVC
jgi:transcriptional regulator of nitric oxide reductase